MLNNLFSSMPMLIAFFWVVILTLHEKKNYSKRYLAFFLTLSVINYFVHWLYFNHQYKLYSIFDSVWVFTSLSGYPLFYYYIRLLTKDVKVDWKWVWLIIPSALIALLSAVSYIIMTPNDLNTFIQGMMYHKFEVLPPYPISIKMQLIRLLLFKLVFVVQVGFVLYFGLKLLRDYNQEIKKFYSQIQTRSLNPVQWLLIFFVLASVISGVSSIIGKDYFIQNPWMLCIPSIAHSLCLFGFGFVGCRQDFTIEHFQKDIDESEMMYPTLEDTTTCYESVKDGLIMLLEQQQIYTNPELRISDISNMLNTNRTYVSRLINDDLKTNFSDFINTYRINHSKRILTDHSFDSLSLSQIAEIVGFSSDSTFYRTFKQKTGVSPGDFRRNHGNNQEAHETGNNSKSNTL